MGALEVQLMKKIMGKTPHKTLFFGKLLNMLRCVLLLLFIPLFGFSFKEKCKAGLKGDYVVYRQGHQISFIGLFDRTDKTLIIEEIHTLDTNPKLLLDAVEDWVKNGAVGSTQWVLYEMTLDNPDILEAYCPPKKAFISFDLDLPILPKFFLVNWELMPDQRRKILPKTQKVWSPPKLISNKNVFVEKSDLYRKYWDEDSSVLSGLRIDLHYDPKSQETFPYMIDIQNKTHPLARFSQIDQGKFYKSAIKYFPRRPPEFEGGIQQKGAFLSATLRCPKGFAPFSLFLQQVGTPHLTGLDFTYEKRGDAYILKIELPKGISLKDKTFRLSAKTSGVHSSKIDSIEVFEIN
ncbi:MAG: hypothetical protein FJZ62_05645 [Chlamydiae bacterium]|nr:hypothetical protein [Chlamydiota bacterium]